MLFRSKKKKHKAPKLNTTISGQIFEMVNQREFLGVIMDEPLSWKAHINHITSKIAKYIRILIRGRHILMTQTL